MYYWGNFGIFQSFINIQSFRFDVFFSRHESKFMSNTNLRRMFWKKFKVCVTSHTPTPQDSSHLPPKKKKVVFVEQVLQFWVLYKSIIHKIRFRLLEDLTSQQFLKSFKSYFVFSVKWFSIRRPKLAFLILVFFYPFDRLPDKFKGKSNLWKYVYKVSRFVLLF